MKKTLLIILCCIIVFCCYGCGSSAESSMKEADKEVQAAQNVDVEKQREYYQSVKDGINAFKGHLKNPDSLKIKGVIVVVKPEDKETSGNDIYYSYEADNDLGSNISNHIQYNPSLTNVFYGDEYVRDRYIKYDKGIKENNESNFFVNEDGYYIFKMNLQDYENQGY